MNPAAIIAILVVLAIAYIGFSGSDFSFFSGGGGPIAAGPGQSAEIQNPQPVQKGGFFDFSQTRQDEKPVLKPGESPYKGKIRISSIQRSGDRPDEEYIILRHGGFFSSAGSQERPIDITGWIISSRRSQETIPRAYNIPEIDAQEQDIFLPPGGELIILSGALSYTRNFRENACVGYFNQTHAFRPALSNSCIDDNPERSDLLSRGFNGACIDIIQSLPSCRTPPGPFQAGVIGSGCIDYMNENFSYVGCVKNFRDQKDFLKNTWRVSLKRSQKLFDSRHDRVILRDSQGLLVDEFEY